MSSAKWRPVCPGGDELRLLWRTFSWRRVFTGIFFFFFRPVIFANGVFRFIFLDFIFQLQQNPLYRDRDSYLYMSCGSRMRYSSWWMTMFLSKERVRTTYHQTSNTSRTKSQHFYVFRLVLLSLPNPLKPCVKSGICSWEQRRQAMLQLHLSDQQ